MAAEPVRRKRRERQRPQAEQEKPSRVSYAWLFLATSLAGVAISVVITARMAQQPVSPPASEASVTGEPDLPALEPPGPAYSPAATTEELWDEARRVAEQVAQTYAQNPTALGVLARLKHARGDSQAAVILWQRGVDLDPAYADGYFGIGTTALRRGEFTKAQKSLQRVAELTPGDARVPTALAAAWLGLGRVQEVIAVLEKSAQAEHLAPDAAVLLGQAYLQLEQYDQAQRLFEQLVQESPQEPKAYYGLARCCLQLGHREEARQFMQRFQEFQQVRVEEERRLAHAFSDVVSARRQLVQTLLDAATVYAQVDDADQAERLWRSVAWLAPEHVASRQLLLRLYQVQGRSRAALAIGEQLCGLEPAKAEHWFQVAVLRGWLKEFDSALTAADRALELDPQNARYRQVREVIRSGKASGRE